jgi:hypothetical protein
MKNSKHCPYCQSRHVIKKGRQSNKQKYLCRQCGKKWVNANRQIRLAQRLWREYSLKHKTVANLAQDHSLSKRKIWQVLSEHEVEFTPPPAYSLPITMDVTYFGRDWGMLVVIDASTHLPIYVREVNGTEKTLDYELAIRRLLDSGFIVQAAVIDGRKGVRDMLLSYSIPVQLCQFHQLMTITQCLTRRPKLPANIELRTIALTLTRSTEEEFSAQLLAWHQKYGNWLKERTLEPTTGRLRYTHDRTRRAYFSLKRNLPYLFTYQSRILAERGIKLPNTANALDGLFGTIKSKLKLHRGASKTLRIKLFCNFLSVKTEVKKT